MTTPSATPEPSTDIMVVSLFDSRHPLPPNQGAICSGFDFINQKAIRTELWQQAVDHVNNGSVLYLYVTGLTPALTEFTREVLLADPKNAAYMLDYNFTKVVLLHYDKASDSYWHQLFL